MSERKSIDFLLDEVDINENGKYIHLGKKLAKIIPTSWDYDFEVDKVFKIDPSNIFGEIITIPLFVNRMGILVAEMRTYVKELKLYLEMKQADVAKIFRKERTAATTKKPTVAEVDEAVMLDPVIKALKFKAIKAEEQLEKLSAMYDSAKDKSFKLNSLSKNLTVEMFESELLAGVVNGVMIEIKKRDKFNN